MKNSYRPKSLGSKGFFILVIMLLVLTVLAVILNIPVLRQVFGFIFLTFIPGFLFLSILKLNRLGLIEKIVLSVGLSVAFLMLFGLALNGSLLAIGYTKPLSTASLLISFSTATIILAVISYIRNKDIAFTFSSLKLTTGEKAFLIVPALFPLLSIVGMRIMNLTNNNVILMLLLVMIPVYVIFISFFNRHASERVYPTAIFLISISLLLMYSLRSNHIIGSDVHVDYFIFLTTMDNFKWSQLGFPTLDSCLSVSMLPAVYQIFLNIDPEYLYKLFPSLIVSILPLAVYLLSKKYIGSFYAFLASFFFMSQTVFLWTPSYARTNIAILFFSLAVLVMFHDGISEFVKRMLFIIFAACIVLSHYGVTYATFFTLLLTWLGMQILPKIISRTKAPETTPAGSHIINKDPPVLPFQRGSPRGSDAMTDTVLALEPSQPQLRRGLTITLVTLFLAMLFFWYSQIIGPTFSSGVRFIQKSFTTWRWLLIEDTGGGVVQAAMGKTLAYTGVPQRIEFVISWLTILFVAIGLLAMIIKFKGMVSTPGFRHEKPNFLLKKFELEYLVLSIVCFLLLVVMVAVPHVSKYYGSARTYFQMVVPLSIFFVIGGIEVARYLKSRPQWLILAVLLPYFLSTTGMMCQVFNYPRAITLNSEGPRYGMYISDAESYAAKWVKEYSEEGITINAHHFARDLLISQAQLAPRGFKEYRLSELVGDREVDGYIYLRYLDIVDGGLKREYPGLFAASNKIYDNSKSEVYLKIPPQGD